MPSTQTDRLRGLTTSVAVKAPVVAASTGNLVLNSTQVIDGYVTSTGDRVLVKDQTGGSTENGIYIVRANDWQRAADCDGGRDLVQGTIVWVSSGSTANTNYDRFWQFSSTGSTEHEITPGLHTITLSELPVSVTTVTISSNVAFLNVAQTWTAPQICEIVTLTDSSSIAIDMSSGSNFTVTLAGTPREFTTPTGITAGQAGEFEIKQDGTGGRTLTYSTAFEFEGGTAPTLTTASSAVDILSYYARSTANLACLLLEDFS